MPFSQTSQITTIVQYMEWLQPTSILDVGTGMGQYGFLARMNLEHAHLFEVNGTQGHQRPRSEWRITIDGIEGCAAYQTPVHDYCYTHWWLGEALQVLPTLADNAYELVLAIDILEHLEKPAGYQFLRELLRIGQRAVLVSTPKEFMEQEVPANPYENHRSFWTQAELSAAGLHKTLENPHSWIMTWEHATQVPDK